MASAVVRDREILLSAFMSLESDTLRRRTRFESESLPTTEPQPFTEVW